MIAQRWKTEPISMQMHVRKNRNAGQAKPATEQDHEGKS
jgi:hypothetical protein